MSKYWKIPPDGDAAFVSAMEDVLNVYRLPYDPRFPVVCMDESSKQLIGEVHAPIATKPGQVAIADHEYVRQGVAMLFVEVEPLAGRRHVEVTERRTRQEWAHFIKGMLEERYPEAIKVRLVMDNLNTHAIASLYETFPPAEARRLADRLEIHYTPKHGSWLNIAEIELSALNSQCLRRRTPDIDSCSAKPPRGKTTATTAALPSTDASQPKALASNCSDFIRTFRCYWILGRLPGRPPVVKHQWAFFHNTRRPATVQSPAANNSPSVYGPQRL